MIFENWNEDKNFIMALILGIIVALIITIPITNKIWRASAIQHNAAYYDSKTGDFKWNDMEKK